MTTIKDAEDAPLSHKERVSDARIIPRQSERNMDTETSQSLSNEVHTVIFHILHNLLTESDDSEPPSSCRTFLHVEHAMSIHFMYVFPAIQFAVNELLSWHSVQARD